MASAVPVAGIWVMGVGEGGAWGTMGVAVGSGTPVGAGGEVGPGSPPTGGVVVAAGVSVGESVGETVGERVGSGMSVGEGETDGEGDSEGVTPGVSSGGVVVGLMVGLTVGEGKTYWPEFRQSFWPTTSQVKVPGGTVTVPRVIVWPRLIWGAEKVPAFWPLIRTATV